VQRWFYPHPVGAIREIGDEIAGEVGAKLVSG
jgi:hypothetical protein